MIWNSAETYPITKLHPPQLVDGIVHRPELLLAFYEAVTSKRLTLISAPAGAGKTTAVVAMHEAYPDLPMVWVSLDEGDDDPRAFLRLMLAGLREKAPSFGLQLQELLDNLPGDAPNYVRLAGLLVNEMVAHFSQPLLLVLDDLHRLQDEAIFKLLDYLLERLPANLHLITTTRSDPPLNLSRLRARSQMAEFRLQNLQFSIADSTQLLNHTLHLDLTANDVATLHQKSKGWIAALRLYGLSLGSRDAAARSRFVQKTGRIPHFVFDFLADEVLQQQSVDVRHFLLETAVLAYLTPSLCDALTQRTDAEWVLHDLYRSNLFLTLVDDEGGELTYRYHDLFKDFLQLQLRREQPRQWRELHVRAAHTLGQTTQAIPHLVAAEAWGGLSDLLVELAKVQNYAGFVDPRFEQWLNYLPQEIVAESAWLMLVNGRLLVQQGQVIQSEPFLQQALAAFQTTADWHGEVQAVSFLTQRLVGNDFELIDRLGELLQQHPDWAHPSQHIGYLSSKFWHAVYRPDWETADESLNAIVDHVIETNDVASLHIVATMITPPILFSFSGLAPLDRLRAMFTRHATDHILIKMGLLALTILLEFMRGNVEACQEAARDAFSMLDEFGNFGWLSLTPAFARFILNRIYLSQPNEYQQAVKEIERLLTQFDGTEIGTSRRNDVIFTLAWMHWQQNKADACRPLVLEMANWALYKDQEANAMMVSAMQGMLDGEWETAVSQLRTAIIYQQVDRQILSSDARLILAQLYWRKADPAAALRELAVALADWRQRDMPGIVLMEGQSIIPLLQLAVQKNVEADFARRCLSVLQKDKTPQPVAIPNSVESLTPREAEVLRLLVDGAGNRAIGEQLVISERTVKSHVTKILAKLGVSSRMQAAARARELHLV
ncbi:MAG: hypothetical protein DWQ04_21235 [Chloroflexi bacterium]|nr:MAG: hypothetical protein DWQ04_21235 [Chloroflexota bacterium]